jgi:hypothetical protein
MTRSTAARRLNFKGVLERRADATALLPNAGDAFIVERGVPRWIVFRCPCGCGEELPINLDPRAGPAWRIYRGKRGVTLFPSVWRDTGCKSHFVLWDDAYLMFDGGGDSEDVEHDAIAPEEVTRHLPQAGLASFVEIADKLRAIPWAVLDTCRALVRKGHAREGAGNERGKFGRRS